MCGIRIVFGAALLLSTLTGSGCTLVATRPVQLMSDTSSAIKAAKEVQADTLSPELYRQANEWFFRAKREYKYKNFYLTQEYAETAKRFAEQAEYDALRGGGNRNEIGGIHEDAAPSVPEVSEQPAADPWPTPAPTPADEYDERKAAEEAAKKKTETAKTPVPEPSPADQQNYFRPTLRGK